MNALELLANEQEVQQSIDQIIAELEQHRVDKAEVNDAREKMGLETTVLYEGHGYTIAQGMDNLFHLTFRNQTENRAA